jgi:hypothetical protein
MAAGALRRVLILVFVAVTAAFCFVGTAGASVPRTAGPASVVPVNLLSQAAPAADSDKPTGCFESHPSPCVSSDPDVELGFKSSGDTSGCKFEITIGWGDKSDDTTDSVSGGSNGTKYGPYKHEYTDPGPFTINWSTTVTTNNGSGGCVPSSGTDQFTLITAGIYRDFGTLQSVTQAADGGWGLIANVAGRQCATYQKVKGKVTCAAAACSADSYVQPTGSDLNVERGLSIQAKRNYPAWISYWTPTVPAVGASLYGAGYLAGQKAATELEDDADRVTTPSTPTYVVLDFEESPSAISCGKAVKPPQAKKNGDKQCWDWDHSNEKLKVPNCFVIDAAGWKNFAHGWQAGVLSENYPLTLTPAIYLNKTQYNDEKVDGKNVGDWGVPVIIALDPVSSAGFTGANIVGYAAYGDDATCDNAKDLIKHVQEWGGISTIQFHEGTTQSVYCKP